MAITAHRLLALYAGILTAAVAVFLVHSAFAVPRRTIDVLDVQRINIREPDGTLRMTLSDAARAPGLIVKGREYPHPTRHSAGMIFFNDEGTENGGLIFDGHADHGRRESMGTLTFDRYQQDQVVQLVGSEDGADRYAGLMVNDQPDPTFDYAALGRLGGLSAEAQRDLLVKAHFGGTHRLFVGRSNDGASRIALKDAAGHDRLILAVAPDGAASIRFLDASGKVRRTVQP